MGDTFTNQEDVSAKPNGGQVILYETADGHVQVDVRLDQETVWLMQRQMAAVFATSPENVLMHLRNVFTQDELDEQATTKDFLVVRQEGARQVRRSLKHYNLDAIISVGYRVKPRHGTQFRFGPTRTLRQHLVRGYMLTNGGWPSGVWLRCARRLIFWLGRYTARGRWTMPERRCWN